LRREGERLIAMDPPTGFWPQTRKLLFWALIHISLLAAWFVALGTWFAIGFGGRLSVATIATMWKISLGWFTAGNGWLSIAATCYVTVGLAAVVVSGRFTLTLAVDADQMTVQSHSGVPWRRRLRVRTLFRREIVSITTSHLFGGLVIHADVAKKSAWIPWNRRADTKGLARVLRNELGLSHPR
jgi:hypothetical protein